MLSWLAGRRSPSGVHLLTADPLAALSPPADKQQAVYAVSRVNPVFREESWPGGARPAGDGRAGWQQSAAGGSTYWHEPPPDSSLQLETATDPADNAADGGTATAASASGPSDSLEPPTSLRPARRSVEYPGNAPPLKYPPDEVAEVHRGPRAHHVGASLPGEFDLHRRMDLHRGQTSGRPSTLPRPVWPSSAGGPSDSERPRCFSVSGSMTDFIADQVDPTRPISRQLPPRGADGRFVLQRQATYPPTKAGFAGRLPSIPDEDAIEAAADGQPDSIVTESLLQLTTPRSTPAGSVRDGYREGDSRAGSTAAESFHWEAAGGGGGGVAAGVSGGVSGGVSDGVVGGVVGGTAERPPALPPLAPPPPDFSWSRTLEPLMQVLWPGEESPPVLRRDREASGSAGDRYDAEAGLPPPWRGSEAGSEAGPGHYPAPPSRASSELSQLYAELAAPRPAGSVPRALSEGLYAWPVSPPVAVPAALLQRPPPPPVRSGSPAPAYLNQLLPSDASDGGRRSRLGSDCSSSCQSQPGRVCRTPSDACSDSSRGSRGSRSRLLPASDSSEGGSERRVTFSADTVDNEPGPSRPRPRRLPERPAGPGPTRSRSGRTRARGFYTANVLSRLTGTKHKTGEKRELEFRDFTLDVGRAAALRRQAARRWRSRHLCSAVTVVVVMVLLLTAGGLIAWLWTTERRLFQGLFQD